MKKENMYTDAEAYRNSLLMTIYGMEERIKNAKNIADYTDLIRRTGTLAENMAKVIGAMAASGETLEPIDDKTAGWLKNI